MSNIQISSINTRFSGGEISGVDVRFGFKGLDGRVDSNTRIEMTPEEYQGNEPLDKLQAKVAGMMIEALEENLQDEEETE